MNLRFNLNALENTMLHHIEQNASETEQVTTPKRPGGILPDAAGGRRP
jgi:hypothetical protein